MIFQLKPLAQHNFLVGEEGGELREAELEVVVGGVSQEGCVSTTVTAQCTALCAARRPGSTPLCVRIIFFFECICS